MITFNSCGAIKYWHIFILDWRLYVSRTGVSCYLVPKAEQLRVLVLTAAAVFLEKRLNKGLSSEFFLVSKIFPVGLLFIKFGCVFDFAIMLFASGLQSHYLAYI